MSPRTTLAVVCLAAAVLAAPGTASAAPPTVTYSLTGVAGDNGWSAAR